MLDKKMLTKDELLDRIISRWDVEEICDFFEITSDELMDRFDHKLDDDDIFDRLQDELDENY